MSEFKELEMVIRDCDGCVYARKSLELVLDHLKGLDTDTTNLGERVKDLEEMERWVADGWSTGKTDDIEKRLDWYRDRHDALMDRVSKLEGKLKGLEEQLDEFIDANDQLMDFHLQNKRRIIALEKKPEQEGHDFLWAVEQIKNGKNVKRSGWSTYLRKQSWSNGIANRDNVAYAPNIDSIEATDWVLAEE